MMGITVTAYDIRGCMCIYIDDRLLYLDIFAIMIIGILCSIMLCNNIST